MKFMLNHVLGFEFMITNSGDEFRQTDGPKLAYSAKSDLGGVCVAPHGLLFESGVEGEVPDLKVVDGKVIMCEVNGGEMEMDPFAASFYLISRYEEYLPFKADDHGRFPPAQSMLARHGVFRRPVVDEWAMEVLRIIEGKYPDTQRTKRSFAFISTIDVDNAFAYRSKGVARTVGAFGKDAATLKPKNAGKRLKAVMGGDDPYDTYEYQLGLKERYGFRSIYFWLYSEFGKHDRSASVTDAGFHRLIRSVTDQAECGIHPSYDSDSSRDRMEREIQGLSDITHHPITKSRQHYLKLRFPATYVNLLACGIREDHSMGYAAEYGFRAGTCTPFLFYNLETEQETQLTVYPFAFMDVTAYMYKKDGTEVAKTIISELIENVKKVNGTFISVWHNRTFSEEETEWKGWNAVYEYMIGEAVG